MFDSRVKRLTVLFVGILLVWSMGRPFPQSLQGQNLQGQSPPVRSLDAADAAGPRADDAAVPAGQEDSAMSPKDRGIQLFRLANEGGIFMYPLYALSILAVGVIIERSLALRKRKVLPPELVTSLGQLSDSRTGFDPKQAYRTCQIFPSAAASVIRSMLLKVGRPHSEVEATVQQSSEREANRLYGNVRWLNLCATLAPLIGLLGTVQGMIMAFHRTTILPTGANTAVELASGIYTALVTTFGGLCIAIPAAFAAHYFEGRIEMLFHDLEELTSNLLPLIERYEGRVRFQKQADDEPPAAAAVPPPASPPRAATSVAPSKSK